MEFVIFFWYVVFGGYAFELFLKLFKEVSNKLYIFMFIICGPLAWIFNIKACIERFKPVIKEELE